MNYRDCDYAHTHLAPYPIHKETASTAHCKPVVKGKYENSRQNGSDVEELLFKEQQLNRFLEEENLFLKRERIKWANLQDAHKQVLQENQKLKLQLKEQEEKLNAYKKNYETEVRSLKTQIENAHKNRTQTAKSYADLKNNEQADKKKHNFLIQLESRVSLLEKETLTNRKSETKRPEYNPYPDSSIRANRSTVEEHSNPTHLTPYRSRNNLYGYFSSVKDREAEINRIARRRIASHSEYPDYCPTCRHTHLKSQY